MFYVRQELIDNAPDVVQAISDAFMEATLWIRLNPDKAADLLAQEPILKAYGKPLLLQQTELYNNLYKPTYSYTFAKLWGEENARIAKWLKDRNRLTKILSAEDYTSSFDTRFMDRTYDKLGWKIRRGRRSCRQIGRHRSASCPTRLRQCHHAQAAPALAEPGDLVRPWTFNGKTYQP